MEMFQRHPFTRRGHPPAFSLMYVLSALFILHLALIQYSNSTYIEQLVRPEMVGIYYAIGSGLAVVMLLLVPRFLGRISNYTFAVVLMLLEITALIIVGLNLSVPVTLAAFVASLLLIPLIGFTRDLFAESLMGSDESQTGRRWSLMLTAMTVVTILASLTLSVVVGADSTRLKYMYFISAGVLALHLMMVLVHFRNYSVPAQQQVGIRDIVRFFIEQPEFRGAFAVQFIFKVFTTAKWIYVPLYLAIVIGFAWDVIGILLAVHFLGYLFTEYPIGKLADGRLGEKEMMALGFLILALSMCAVGFIHIDTTFVWMALLFVLAFGGSLVETTITSYFYKHTDGDDASPIGFFRTAREFAAIIGALIGSAALLYLPFHLIFVIIGVLALPGVFVALWLHDTR